MANPAMKHPMAPQHPMSPATSHGNLSHLLTNARIMFIKGRKSWLQILTDLEARNKYEVLDEHKQTHGWIVEQGSGIGALLKRWFFKSHRPLHCQVIENNGNPVLEFRRKFFFFFSDMEVYLPDGRKLGSAHRRFAFFAKRYDLRDATGQTFARINAGIFRIWTFKILDATGQERAVITKKWGGAFREFFSDADTFQIDYGTMQWHPTQRAVIFATAMSIDFDFFERNVNNGGMLS